MLAGLIGGDGVARIIQSERIVALLATNQNLILALRLCNRQRCKKLEEDEENSKKTHHVIARGAKRSSEFM
jgi:hypothetical protein